MTPISRTSCSTQAAQGTGFLQGRRRVPYPGGRIEVTRFERIKGFVPGAERRRARRALGRPHRLDGRACPAHDRPLQGQAWSRPRPLAPSRTAAYESVHRFGLGPRVRLGRRGARTSAGADDEGALPGARNLPSHARLPRRDRRARSRRRRLGGGRSVPARTSRRVGERGLGEVRTRRRCPRYGSASRPDSALSNLADNLRAHLATRGVPFDAKPFRPHITLARRVRIPAAPLPALAFPQNGTAPSVTLFKSTLDRAGAVYKPLHSALLPTRR